MTGSIAVDTNAVIAYREGNPEICGLIEEAEVIIVPAAVWGELLYAAVNSSYPDRNKKAFELFLAQALFAPIDIAIARQYALIRAALKGKGRPIPENDIWIGATCLEFEIPLLSNDKHFGYIEELQVISWSETDS